MFGSVTFPELDTSCKLSKKTWLERGRVEIFLHGTGSDAIGRVLRDVATPPAPDRGRTVARRETPTGFYLKLEISSPGVTVEVAADRAAEDEATVHRHIIRSRDLACLKLHYMIRRVQDRSILVEEREAGAWYLPSGRSIGGEIYRFNIFRYLPSKRLALGREAHLREVLGACAMPSPEPV
jgi:hypothetical protein